MYISHKSNVIQHISEMEWECRLKTKGMESLEAYKAWLETITTVTGTEPVAKTTIDYSGETGYTIVKCTDEDIRARLVQLDDYISDLPEGITYNIKYYASKRDSEIVDVSAHTIPAHKDEDGNDVAEEDVAATYVQTHFIGDDTAKDARILAEQWTRIRQERDRLLAETDWTQGSDSPLASGKKTEWATYRTKLRTLPEDQKAKKTYADITWPSQPS